MHATRADSPRWRHQPGPHGESWGRYVLTAVTARDTFRAVSLPLRRWGRDRPNRRFLCLQGAKLGHEPLPSRLQPPLPHTRGYADPAAVSSSTGPQAPPPGSINRVCSFTARLNACPRHISQRRQQRAYLGALATLPGCPPYYRGFRPGIKRRHLAESTAGLPPTSWSGTRKGRGRT